MADNTQIKTKQEAIIKILALIGFMDKVAVPDSKLERLISANIVNEELQKIYEYIDKHIS